MIMILAVVMTSISGVLFSINVAQADTTPPPSSLLISAVQITGGVGKTSEDFIELFNPNPSPVNLNGYRLVKRTATATTDSSIKSF